MKPTLLFTLLATVLSVTASALPNAHESHLEKRLLCSGKRHDNPSNCPHLNALCSYSYCDADGNCASAIDPNCYQNHIDKRVPHSCNPAYCPQFDSLCSYSYCNADGNCASAIDQDCLKEYEGN